MLKLRFDMITGFPYDLYCFMLTAIASEQSRSFDLRFQSFGKVGLCELRFHWVRVLAWSLEFQRNLRAFLRTAYTVLSSSYVERIVRS